MNEQIEQTMDALLNAVMVKPEGWMIWLSIGISLVLAMIMWISYGLANGRESYNPKFAATLIILALISTILMNLIQSNLALSLGMLGSFSIVRFRTNIKDPRDIGFIFWSMAIGIASATQSYLIGIIGSFVLATVMILTKKHGELKYYTKSNLVKAKNILSDSFEVVYEVKIEEKNDNKVIDQIFNLGAIDSINLLAQND